MIKNEISTYKIIKKKKGTSIGCRGKLVSFGVLKSILLWTTWSALVFTELDRHW